MSTQFQELDGFLGIHGFFLYDHQKNQMLQFRLGSAPDERTVRQFISTYLSKQQIGMDIAADFVILNGSQKNLVLSRHKQAILGLIAALDTDMMGLQEKIKELWTRFDLGL